MRNGKWRPPGPIIVACLAIWLAPARGQEPSGSVAAEIPPAFAPFEHLIGAWKGQAVPRADRLRGWTERHLWAWSFQEGRPAGMTATFEGDKTIAKAKLSFDPKSKIYRLAGTDPDGKDVTFAGPLDAKGQTLTLDRVGAPSAGKGQERLTIRLNSNQIRYTWLQESKEPGAPQFAKVLDANLGKEGESFASGGAEEDLPECVLTGGAATLSVSYQGKSYPVCCTGCRDEFLADPEKYVRKAALRAAADGGKPATKAAKSRRSANDGDFEGLVEEAPKTADEARPKAIPRDSQAAKTDAPPKPDEEPAAKPAQSDGETRALTNLKLGQSLEKAGKTAAALDYYRRVVKDFPKTKAARTAQDRIKALSGR